MNTKENPISLPGADIQKVRDSVARTDTPLARSLHDFLRRLELQSHIIRPKGERYKTGGPREVISSRTLPATT